MRRAVLLALLATAILASSADARAQRPTPRPPPPQWCIPGTTLCIQSNGQGGAGAGGTANGQVGPNGASGNAQGNAQGNGQAQGNGRATPPPPPPPPRVPPPPPPPPRTPPPAPKPPPPAPPPSPSNNHPIDHGDWSSGFLACGLVRAGLYSGFHGGGCLAMPIRSRSVGFDFAETQLTAGGTLPMFDVVFSPVSALVPLASGDSTWTNAYLRVGFQIGHSWGTGARHLRSFRFGGHVGFGYEVKIASGVALRLVDLRASAEATGYDADRLGHGYDLGVTLSTGIVFF